MITIPTLLKALNLYSDFDPKSMYEVHKESKHVYSYVWKLTQILRSIEVIDPVAFLPSKKNKYLTIQYFKINSNGLVFKEMLERLMSIT